MAATVVKPMAVPRLRASSPAPRAMAAASLSLGRRASMLLPGSTGLRMAASLPRVNGFAPSSKAGHRGSVVCEAAETTVQLPDVTKSTWQSLIMESEVPVLVDFWAPWCGPCRMIEPTIVKLAKDYEGRLKCYKLNTDENPDIATQYGIRSIPTMMIFKNGEKKDAVIGAVPESTLITTLEKFISR